MDRRKELNLILDAFAYLIGTLLLVSGIATSIGGIIKGITIPALVLGGILFIGSLVAIVVDSKHEVKSNSV
ncbi:MAG: hypothetical protein FK730_15045 [Asgard group archaeon]|nr:hypothetical protein [Asgard group archaeon]